MPPVRERWLEVHCLDPETGIWCSTCAKPSGERVLLVFVVRATLRVVARKQVTRCSECEDWL